MIALDQPVNYQPSGATTRQENRFDPIQFASPDEHQTNLIAARKAIGSYKGWSRYYKKQLQQERAAHTEQIRRIHQNHRQEKEKLTEQLTRQLNERHKREVAKLKEIHEKIIAALNNKIIEQERELALFRDQHSGKGQSEKFTGNSLDKSKNQQKETNKKKKSKPPKNPGRKPHSELPAEDVVHEIPDSERVCADCELPYEDTGMAEQSEENVYTVTVRRKRNIRKIYKKTCQCPRQPIFKTAPLPPKAMTRSKYNDGFWHEVILYKYYYQIPLTRLIKNFHSHGMENVKSNTLSTGIERYSNLVKPLDEAIIERNLQANFWQADGSRLPVFVPREYTASFNWALWQYQTDDTTVFQLSDSKEAIHVQNYMAQAQEDQKTEKVLLSDRDAVFKTLWFTIVFCWVHMRRDFIRVGRYTKGNRTWAISWLKHIRQLYRYYKARKKAELNSDDWKRADAKIRQQITFMEKQLDTELANEKLENARKKVLNSLKNHWHGLTRFIDDLRIPMDNNRVERIFRLVANLRKTSYGVHSEKFGHSTARFLTIFTTLDMHNINIRHFLEVYMEVVAANDGNAPDNIADFLPWSMSDQIRKKLQLKRQPCRDGPA
jgi:transposase